MGRFAQVLGIGVGGDVTIELQKTEFYAGEFVCGNVKLRIQRPVEAEGFVLTLRGKEHLGWHQQHGKESRYHHIEHTLHEQQIQLLASSGQTLFQAGEYNYALQFLLPPSLPSSHSFYKPTMGQIRRVTSSLFYKLKAEVTVKGMLKADISGAKVIGVHALPRPLPQLPHPVEDATTRPVTFMCCFIQGPCCITGSSSTNVVNLFNGGVRVQGSVRNDSTTEIKSVSIRLYEDFTMHIPDGFTQGGLKVIESRRIHEQKFAGVAPGASSKDDVVAEISMSQVRANIQQYADKTKDFFGDKLRIQQPFDVPAVFPSTDLLFVSIGYHIGITCHFAWCSSVVLELPLVVYLPPPPPPPMVMVMPMPTPVASPGEKANQD